MANKHKELWDNLIAELVREVVNIEKQPQKLIEDVWISGTLKNVLKKMCALHRLHPSMQKSELTRELFE